MMLQLKNSLADKTFENFTVNKENRLAHAASLAVAEKPGTDYNPFFMHSSYESGAEAMHHLLAAIGNRVEKIHAGKIVLYATGHDIESLIKEIHSEGTWLDMFAGIDMLLLENLHEASDASLGHLGELVEYMTSHSKQIVISSNLHPKELSGIDFPVATQISVGMVVGISENL